MRQGQERVCRSRLSVVGLDESRMSVQDASRFKTLLITNDFGPRAGGIETFIIGLLQRMPQGSCIVYTSHQDDSKEYDKNWLTKHGVTVIRDRARILLPTPRVAKALRKIVREESISHLWFGAAAPLAIMDRGIKRSAQNPIRSIALTHGHEVWWAKIPPFSFAIRSMARSLDQIGYLTNYTKGEIAKGISKEDQQKLRQIAPGIDIDHFTASKDSPFAQDFRERDGLHGKRFIITVGRLVHRKGQDRLVQALSQIKREIPDAHLLIVGQGPHQEKITKLIKKYGLEDSVTFLGRLQLEELPRYLAMASLFAMPSRDRLAGFEVEGLGIVYLEASSCGLPVIVGRSGGAVDALIDGETGLLVNGDDVDEIAKACIRILSDDKLRERLGARGAQWVRENWNWDRWAGEFQDALLR
jgi:phosphatidylinositol alpha-1,6-mannosyltransferase